MKEWERECGEFFSLSQSQMNIWNLEKAFPGTPMNIISTTIRIAGQFDIVALQNSIDTVLRADPSLRSHITLSDGQPVQYHASMERVESPVLDFSLTDAEGFAQWESSTAREPMSLLDAPLFRFYIFRSGEDRGGIFVKIHHIISDGWSQVLLCNRIAQTYLELISGKAPSLEPSPSYRIHVDEENEYYASKTFIKDGEYWQSVLDDAGDPSVLKDNRGAALSPVGRRLTFRLPEVLNHAIYTFCSENRVAPFAVYYMALAIYLKRMGGPSNFTIGAPVHNRTNFTARETTGMFVSTLPLCNTLDENWSFVEFNQQLSQRWFDLLRHQRFPFSQIAAKRSSGEGRLFHIALSYQDTKIMESEDTSICFSGRWHYSGYQSEHLCIHLTNLEDHRHYTADYDYLSQLFTDSEIECLHIYLCRIVEQALAHPDRPIGQLSILSLAQREQVLYSFNAPANRRPVRCGPFEALRKTAEAHPNRIAAIENGNRISYAQLMKNASGPAAAISEKIGAEGRLVAVMLPRGIRLLTVMTGIMGSGNAWLLLDIEMPIERIAQLIERSGAAMLISSSDILAEFSTRLPNSLPILDTEAMGKSAAGTDWTPAGPDGLAYVVYTSGSTGEPKGVEITGGNLLNFCRGKENIFSSGAIISISNVTFDAFIIESAVALINGLTIVVADNRQQESPDELARLIKDYGVKYISLTPSRLSAYLNGAAFCCASAGLNAIVCGGEPFPGELLSRLKRLTDAAIFNQYGPSETTVGVSCARLDACARITAGKPMPGCRLYVLDDRLQPLPIGVFGNLYIGGLSVGLGYRGDAALTDAAFLPNPFVGSERMYRSGDIAAWTPDGELLLGGRRDRQVKLRGQRVEPQELASCLALHPAVCDAAAKVIIIENQPVLSAYFTSSSKVGETELLTYLASRLPAYMLPASVIRLEKIPLTANGKVDDCALPDPVFSLGNMSPQTPLQEQILSVFRKVLKKPGMGADSDYFLSGGNSLLAMETIGQLEDILGFRLRVSDLYACRTAQKLEAYLKISNSGSSAGDALPLAPAPQADSYPLSPMQEGIYFECAIAPDSTAYHMPGALRLNLPPDADKLQAAFQTLIDSDDLLRTAFVFTEGKLRQAIFDTVPFVLETIVAETLDLAFDKFLRPFDLANPPLLRAALWNSDVLLVDFHHIVSDGISTPLLIHRLDDFYNGAGSPPTLTYKDYCVALEQRGTSYAADTWIETLKDLPGALDLPTDLPRPRPFDFKGADITFKLSPDLSARCLSFCQTTQLTPFMFFSAAFGLLLANLSGKNDIILGTPVSGRGRPELWDICGPFISTLPLRLNPHGGNSVTDYLGATRDGVLHLLDNQEFPADAVISALGLLRTLGENPLFSVMFSMRPQDTTDISFAGGPVAFLPMPSRTAKFPLSLDVAQTAEGFEFRMEYATSLFLSETINLYCRSFCEIVRQFVEQTNAKLEDIFPLAPADRLRLLERPRRQSAPFWDAPIDDMVSEMALLCPDTAAVIFRDDTMSYRELDDMASRFAGQLISSGAQPGDRIGLVSRRTPRLFAALLGILKAGCAYVPLLSSYPEQRLTYMLETAGVSLVLCDEDTLAELPRGLPVSLIVMDPSAPALTEPVPHTTDSLMYILFTSGSTGRPKGVMVSGKAVANFVSAMRPVLEQDDGPILCSTNLVFDIFFVESLLPLTLGRTVVLADEDEMILPWYMAERIDTAGVTTVQITPSALQMCLTNSRFRQVASRIKLLLLAGEASNEHLVTQFCAVGNARIIDVYGPTEATVYVSQSQLTDGHPVNIGTPLQNCRIYVLDGQQRPVMTTARGELYLAGVCLADGYVARPDLTEAAFVPDPFFPGHLMYKTGDLGRQRADGVFECLGRLDSQIKLNGLRIELDEINGAAIDSGIVSQMVTVSLTAPDGSSALRAFAVPVPTGGPADETALRARMSELLPAYMIPAQFIFLKSMPKNASGKVDLPLLKTYNPDAPGPRELISEDVPVAKDASNDAPAPDEAAFAILDEANQQISIPQIVAEKNVPAETAQVVSVKPVLDKEVSTINKSGLSQPKSTLRGGLDIPGPYGQPAHEAQKKPAGIPRDYDATLAELTEIWTAVLGKTPDPDDSFFKQGGTSLAALNVLSQYFNHGHSLTLATFYDTPTLSGQTALLCGGSRRSVITQKPDDISPRRPAPSSPVTPLSAVPDSVFLTGATGFLGAHILRELLEGGASWVLCLVRGGDRKRLLQTLEYYFGSDWVFENACRIEVVRGDITKPRFGLSRDAYLRLAGQIDAVYHAAADVRHFADDPDNAIAANVTGTRNAADLAMAASVPLNHVSTVSISGDYLPGHPDTFAVFTEADFDIGQNWQDNIYVKGKFLAEMAVYDRVASGLTARVFRVGRLVGRESDGKFQRFPDTNALCSALRSIAALGALPESMASWTVDLTPVDFCAKSIVALSLRDMPVYHIVHPAPVTMANAASALGPIEVLSDEEFTKRLVILSKSGLNEQLSVLIELWSRIQQTPPRISPDCTVTHKALKQLGFTLEPTPPARLLKDFI